MWSGVRAVHAVDDLAEFAIDFLVSGRGGARILTRVLAERWPNRPALELAYALSVAASSMEEVFSGEETLALAREAWRMAGLVGVDLYVAQSSGLPHRTAADLTDYWRAHDPFFLRD